jgi:seryl-tRNA synthetase
MEEQVKNPGNAKNSMQKKNDLPTQQKRVYTKSKEDLLIENFVGLQKAMTNLSIKFENLSDNISRLLEVFELSAKDQLVKSPKEEDKELLNKINSLLDQNKTIAKGLVLIEEKVRDRMPSSANLPRGNVQISSPSPKPLPKL